MDKEIAKAIIEWEFEQAVITASNINEHLQLLWEMSIEFNHITEIGLMYANSSRAFLASYPRKFVSIEKHTVWPQIKNLQKIAIAAGIEWNIINQGSLQIEIEETDIIFFDSYHTYGHLRNELDRHGNKARELLLFHDTETFGKVGEDGSKPGLKMAIHEFLESNPQWKLQKELTHNNGLTILTRERVT